MQILDERWRQLADRERILLQHLVEFLQGFGAPPEDATLVRRKLEDLEELFLLVIVGEFNSGKSAFINALLGEDELSREGVTPTTDRITVLKHGEEAIERERREGILEKEHPNDFLREVAIVDTPGTNAIIRHHEELSRGFVPRSDLVLFVTSSDRPFTESEREYLELIRDCGKKVVLVVNKVDLLRGEEDVAKVRRFVEEGVRSALNLKPPIFFVSSYLARRAKAAGSGLEANALLQASGFEELERYITDLLDEEGRVRLKLESPLGVVEELVRRYRLAVEERVSLLEDDFKMGERRVAARGLQGGHEARLRGEDGRDREHHPLHERAGRRVVRGEHPPRERPGAGPARKGPGPLSEGGRRQHRGSHRRAGRGAHRLDGRPQPKAVARRSRVRQPPPTG